eukprot:1147709-Pleurochrysis_carterae.AAC.1
MIFLTAQVRELIHDRAQGKPTKAARAQLERRRRLASGEEQHGDAGLFRRGASDDAEMEAEDLDEVLHGPRLQTDDEFGEMAGTAPMGFTPQLRIIDGQMVLDEASLQVTASRESGVQLQARCGDARSHRHGAHMPTPASIGWLLSNFTSGTRC